MDETEQTALPPFADRLAAVEDRIAAACARAGRDRSEVTLVGVSKTQPPEVVSEAVRAGLSTLGENRVQEALAKAPLCPSADWHLIGPLQKNKVRHALSLFSTIHAVDSLATLEAIARVSEETGARPDVMLEVNVADEATKHGFSPVSVRDAVRASLDLGGLRLVGLMCIPPWAPEPEASRPRFRALRELRDSLERDFSVALPQLSMGMSGDFEGAVEEGATFVRVGTALFGRRNAAAWWPERSPDSDSYFV
ncbi:MAG: YggS family pyridoxal phosphate-dependent enzyme [Kiritimatiellae bacterium]|nr:YggS family pyridoxal phosphate-dependent enzyme [Kiritimatiellia bacterium]